MQMFMKKAPLKLLLYRNTGATIASSLALLPPLHSPFQWNTNIVLKPTILCVCGPRTRLRVALGLALVQRDRTPNPQFTGFQAQTSQTRLPAGHGPKPTTY